MILVNGTINFSNGTTYNLSQHNLSLMEITIMDRKDITLPSWGIVSNGGKLEIIDYTSEIKELLQTRELNKTTLVNIYLHNTIQGKKWVVGNMYAYGWNYDEERKIASASLTDGLEKMQDVLITPLSKDPTNSEYTSAESIYNYLKDDSVKKGFEVLSFDELDDTTKNHLTNYKIYYAYIESQSLWSAWRTFCEALQLYMFKNRQGKITCVYKEGK